MGIPKKFEFSRQILRFALGITLVALSTGPGIAQTVIDGSSMEGFVLAARRFGQATLTEQPNGDPMLAGRISGVPYAVRFRNCPTPTTCADINFRVGFLAKPTPDVINLWNRDKRFAKAYIDAEGDAILEMDMVLAGGVTAENLNEVFTYWRLSLDQFTKHIGFK